MSYKIACCYLIVFSLSFLLVANSHMSLSYLNFVFFKKLVTIYENMPVS